MLSCPACHRLVHSRTLKQLSSDAARLDDAGRLTAALVVWRRALELLPPETRQHEVVTARIASLRERVDVPGYREPDPEDPGELPLAGQSPSGTPAGAGPEMARSHVRKQALALGVAGLAVWKFKFILIGLASKAKFLLLGLSKSTTLFSMLVYLGPCWAAWGWQFALGIVLSIYVHEMGHVAALSRYGISASAPMFIPGLGALVRLNQYPSDAIEDARIGLAGPLWGFGAALVAYGVALASGHELFAAVAKFGAWINLFNLVPIWQLDGGRAFRALSRGHRFLAAAGAGLAWAWSHEGLLALLVVVGVVRAMSSDCPSTGSKRVLAELLVLVAGLTALDCIPIAIP